MPSVVCKSSVIIIGKTSLNLLKGSERMLVIITEHGCDVVPVQKTCTSILRTLRAIQKLIQLS